MMSESEPSGEVGCCACATGDVTRRLAGIGRVDDVIRPLLLLSLVCKMSAVGGPHFDSVSWTEELDLERLLLPQDGL